MCENEEALYLQKYPEMTAIACTEEDFSGLKGKDNLWPKCPKAGSFDERKDSFLRSMGRFRQEMDR